jgi:hypothetical protein
MLFPQQKHLLHVLSGMELSKHARTGFVHLQQGLIINQITTRLGITHRGRNHGSETAVIVRGQPIDFKAVLRWTHQYQKGDSTQRLNNWFASYRATCEKTMTLNSALKDPQVMASLRSMKDQETPDSWLDQVRCVCDPDILSRYEGGGLNALSSTERSALHLSDDKLKAWFLLTKLNVTKWLS